LPSILTWYGYPKDWLLGAKIATGLGEIIKSGSNTTKFSSGYKIWKTLSGSLGFLGVYLEVNIRLIPYQDFHFEEIKNEEYFKKRPLGIIGVKENNVTKIYAILKGSGKVINVPENYDISIVTVRGKEMEVLREVNGDCIAYYGNGLVRCNNVNADELRNKYIVIKERKCSNNCFGYYYDSLSLLKNSLDPNGVFFDVFH
jgi:FAD/FMN-containing dehydrogenase